VTAPGTPALDPAARRRIVQALLLGVFLAALDVLVVAPALPSVVADLGHLPLYPWIFAAYLLTSTVTAPIFGRLADSWGRKPVYVSGLGLFLLGSVLCGAAPSMPLLVAMRALQGLGAGAVLPITFTLVGDLYPLEQRARMQGVFASVWGVASVVGAPVGGALVAYVGWRAVFYLNLPFGLAAIAIIVRRLQEPARERRGHHLDIPGALALTFGLAAGLVALQRRGAETGGDPWGMGLWTAAVLFLGAFVWRERSSPEPLVDPALLRNRLFLAANAGGFLGFGALYSAMAHVPLMVRGVQGGSAQAAGVALVPLSLSWVAASNAAGRLVLRAGYRAVTTLGGILVVAGCAGLSLLDETGSTLRLYACLIALGVGMGLSMTGFLIAVQGVAPPGRLGIATSAVQFFRSMGGAVGMAVLGAVLLASLRAQGVDPTGVAPGAGAALGGTGELPPAVLMTSLHHVFLTGLVFALGCFVAGAAVPPGSARSLADPSRL